MKALYVAAIILALNTPVFAQSTDIRCPDGNAELTKGMLPANYNLFGDHDKDMYTQAYYNVEYKWRDRWYMYLLPTGEPFTTVSYEDAERLSHIVAVNLTEKTRILVDTQVKYHIITNPMGCIEKVAPQ